MLLTSIAGWAPYSPGPACCLLLASEGLEIKVGAWWLSLTAAGLVGQRMRRLELMTCYQGESHRREQEGQSRILGQVYSIYIGIYNVRSGGHSSCRRCSHQRILWALIASVSTRRKKG